MIVYSGLYADRPLKPKVEDVYEATDTEQYLVCFVADTWKDITTTALHKAIAGEIAAMTEKGTPVDADLLVIEDSADSNKKKKVQVINLPGGGGGGDTHPIADSTAIVKDPVDGTKLVRIDAGAVAAATTRVINMPDKNVTLDDVADPRPPTGHAHTHASTTGKTANDHHNQDHKARHVSGGADAFVSTDVIEAIAKRLRETAGPTTLLMGAVADGEFLKRSGAALIGDTPSGGGGADKGCRVLRTTVQSIAAETWVSVNFTSEGYDTDGMHDNVTNNERITIKTAGKYFIGCYIPFDANATGQRSWRLLTGGDSIAQALINATAGSFNSVVTLITVEEFAVNDYIEAQVFQNSGGSLNVKPVAGGPLAFFAQKIDKGG